MPWSSSRRLWIQVTGDEAAGLRVQRRFVAAAPIHHVGAPGVKPAARRRRERTRNLAAQDDLLRAPAGVERQRRRAQRLGLGMLRATRDLPRRAHLPDATAVHGAD